MQQKGLESSAAVVNQPNSGQASKHQKMVALSNKLTSIYSGNAYGMNPGAQVNHAASGGQGQHAATSSLNNVAQLTGSMKNMPHHSRGPAATQAGLQSYGVHAG